MSTGTIPYLMSPSPSSDDEESVTDTDMISSEYNDFFHMWHHTVETSTQHFPMAIMDLNDDEPAVVTEGDAVDLWHYSCGEWPAHFVDGAPELSVCSSSTNSTGLMTPSPGEKGNTAPPSKQKTHLRPRYYFVGK